jgi:hypothetical protein
VGELPSVNVNGAMNKKRIQARPGREALLLVGRMVDEMLLVLLCMNAMINRERVTCPLDGSQKWEYEGNLFLDKNISHLFIA